ncbi:hypothetical protein [Ornithinimicrobium pekingense]|uniref:Uncharacterized protein n=1 Tax=Ornithinimicrobium pekingense TaxID=384677 RepID=A0ABQ2FA54_9MICO|nr:hypothetical protein [Ornithinimicrobium pekingense]GGK72449.1 hypothetical protein GCM10011509_21250 [Ornithinimicrobium pekingense]
MSAPHAVEWRYAAAGLGWGVAVGAATGLLCGLGWAAVALAGGGVDGGRVVERASLLLGAPVLGLLLGATLGGVVGTPGGLVNAVLQPRLRSDRVAWWSSWAVATLTAALGVALVVGWQLARDVVDPGPGGVRAQGAAAGALALVPALLGGWLTARTGRLLRRRRSAAHLRGPHDRQDASTAACSSERRK